MAALVVSGCSLKKNTAASRQYSAFITRYNIYYNGDTHFKETLDEMEKNYEDDYSRLVFVHPAEARGDESAPQPGGDFTRSIEKAQKAIQLRSIKKKPAKKPGKNDPEYKAWLKRDEYNPFLHNAWMMMGRSQFLNGDFLGAASTFFYISKHFTWLPQTVTEAKIWQARSYCSIDWLFEAEMILTRIKPDELTSSTLTHLYNLTYADFYVKSNDTSKAIPYLREAVATASGSQKTRLNFLLGQLYALDGNRQAAYKAFAAAGGSSSASYRTKLNARIKQSEVYSGSDIKPEVAALRRMTRYDRNKPYLDQIYYAIGNLYLSVRDTTEAIENYELAIEKSTRTGIEQAIAQLTLGGLYYDLGQYEKAQPNYSAAISRVPESYPDYKALKRRSDYLDELAVYYQNVELQDSLLKLSYLTPEEQTAVAERLIEELKKREKEEEERAKREEYLAQQAANGNPLGNNANAPSSFTMNSNNAWYFYNPSIVTAGKTDFQRRWGSRKLEDDWRRRNKSSYAFNTAPEPDDDDSENPDGEELADGEEAENAEELEKANDPHFVEYYLRQIPKTDLERQTCNDVIQEGLYNMGVILKDKLEDYPASEREFNQLLTRYPDNIYRLDTYYNLYLMYVRSNNPLMAEHYRRLIIDDFPDSAYGQAMRDPNYFENLRLMDSRQEALYEKAYNDYLENRNASVHKALQTMKRDFPMSPIMPKFMFIDALAYVTENNPEKFRESLTELLEKYPQSDVTPYAAAYMKGLSQGRQLHSGSGNMRGMLWDIRLSNDSTAGDLGEIEFDLNPDESQLLVFIYPTDSVAPNRLLFDVARHNFSSFVVKDFDLEQMNFGRLGLLIVKPFANLSEINHYRSVMAASPELQLPPQVRPVVISEKNFKTLIDRGASFDDYFRFAADKTYRDTEERVLDPEIFGPSEGIPDPSESPQPPLQEIEEEQPFLQEIEDEIQDEFDDEIAFPEQVTETPGNTAEAEAPFAEEPETEEPEAETSQDILFEEPMTEEPEKEEPEKEQPKAEEPTQEEPKAEEPTQEEPQVEEPTPEKPKVEETPQAPALPKLPSLPSTPPAVTYPTGSEDDPLLD